ncbi:unnamed protein product [Pedinophyceae sp. YPF-701]|nr:unnamed protein product [Pedinophyceae sp. YPF-701]
MAAAINAPDKRDKFVIPPDLKKVEMVRITKQKNAALFEIQREDHTLGDLIRNRLLDDPHVLFVGYKIPHPLEHRLQIQIQTDGHEDEENNNQPYRPRDALVRAIKALICEYDVIRQQLMEQLMS